jgi:hypothetical protein
VNDRPVACYSCAVIPTSWTPVHRPSDAEHVGYLAPDGAPGLVVPTSLVGRPLGPPRPSADATAVLVADGLRILDRRWWCRLPSPMPSGVLPAAQPRADWSWHPVVLVEVSPEGCSVRLEMAEPAELRARAALPVPVGDLLREHAPE